jgi:hypothetical protein
VPEAASDLPTPMSPDEVVDLLMQCVNRGFFALTD